METNMRGKIENTPPTESNPYQSPGSSESLVKKKTSRWIRRAILLNVVLVVIPALFLVQRKPMGCPQLFLGSKFDTCWTIHLLENSVDSKKVR